MARKETIKWFEEVWAADPANVEGFFEVLETVPEGKSRSPTFQEACVLTQVPYTLMFGYVERHEHLKARYQSILQARAEELVEGALQDAESAVCKDTAVAAKVRADTKLRVASKWNQERYGDKLQVEKSISVSADAGLLQDMGELLKLSKRKPRVLEHEPELKAALVAPDAIKEKAENL